MSVDVLTEVDIDAPAPEVAAFATDPANAPAWYVNIASARWVTAPPLQKDSRVEFAARFLGRMLAYTYEVTELVPGARLVMRTSEGPFPMETTYTFAPTSSGGTHMTLRNRGSPTGFGKLAAPLMAAAMRRANLKDLERLKRTMEGR
jgi:uncharacterized protein YndB with AHSA1/START domain